MQGRKPPGGNSLAAQAGRENKMNKIESLIEKILWGKSLADVKDYQDNSRLFVLRSLTIKESNLVNHLYRKAYEEAVFNGIFTVEEAEEFYKDTNLWTEREEDKIIQLESDITYLKNKVKQLEFFTVRQKQVKRKLKSVEKELIQLKNDKINLFSITADNRAEEIKRRYTIMLSTENENDDRYWKTMEEFKQETDFILIYNLAVTYLQQNLFNEKTLREVARNNNWRFRWSAAKMGADLFGRPISEWSEMQNMLVYWSQYYDYIIEHPEKPSENIINDDASCDAWIDGQGKPASKTKSNAENISRQGNKRTKFNSHGEQFIMVAKGDKDAINRVQEMNSPATRAQLRRESKVISNTKGRISEWKLRKGDICKT